jgi:hypothetical protein
MKSEQEIRERLYQINGRLREIINAPGLGGAPEYEMLTRERKTLEWVLGEVP